MSYLEIYPCVVCKDGKCSLACCFRKVLPNDPINGKKNRETADLLFSSYRKKAIKSYLSDVDDSEKAAVIENLLSGKEGVITNAVANLSEVESLEAEAQKADSEIASLEESLLRLGTEVATVEATRNLREGRYEKHENAKYLANKVLKYLDEELPTGVFLTQDMATQVAKTIQIYDEQVSEALYDPNYVQPQPRLILQDEPLQVQAQPTLILPQQPPLFVPQHHNQEEEEGPPPKKSKN